MDIQILKIEYKLPNEHQKLYDMIMWLKNLNYDFDIDYVLGENSNAQKVTVGAIISIVFEPKIII